MMLATILVIVALGLTALEVLFPSFGILGLAAATSYGFALAGAFAYSEPMGWFFVAVGVIGIPLVVTLTFKIAPKTAMGKKLFLSGPLREDVVRGTRPTSELALVGQEGLAVTDLRPAGAIELGNLRLDVVSDGAFITKGSKVRIVNADGTRLVVEELNTNRSTPASKDTP